MFSPSRLFSKYTSSVAFFRRTESSVDPNTDLPTPPDSPPRGDSLPRPFPVNPRLDSIFQQPQSSRSVCSLPIRPKNSSIRNRDALPTRPATASGSPFRSVTNMTEPFNLVLQSSPPLSQHGPRKPSTMPAFNSSPEIRGSSPDLSSHSNYQEGNKTLASLLPSPELPDMKGDLKDRDLINCCYGRLVGAHCDMIQPVAQDQHGRPRYLQRRDEASFRISPSQRSAKRAISLPTASPNRSIRSLSSSRRQSILSSEGDWLAGNLEHPETTFAEDPDMLEPAFEEPVSFKSKQRKCQIVGYSPPSYFDRATHDRGDRSPVGYATVVSTTDLRLVTISRSSSKARNKDSPSFRFKRESDKRPTTPEYGFLNEVSAFSPETPPASQDIGYSSQVNGLTSPGVSSNPQSSYQQGSIASALSLSQPTSPDELSPGKVISSYCIPPVNENTSQDSLSYSPSKEYQLHRAPPVGIPKTDREVAVRCDEFSWILNQLSPFLEEMSNDTLQLDTPVVAHIRHRNHRATMGVMFAELNHAAGYAGWNCCDKPIMSTCTRTSTYLAIFRRIFPYTPDTILSALSATLITKHYLSSFATVQDAAPSNFPSLLEDMERIPPKARATLGIHCSNVTANQRRERLLKKVAGKNVETLRKHVDHSLMTICGRADEFMKRMLESIIDLMMKQ